MREGGSLASPTTSKSARPAQQPTQTTGNLPPPPPPPSPCPTRGNRGGVPRSPAGVPLCHPRPERQWLAGCSSNVGLCLASERTNIPSSSLSSETLGAKSWPHCFEGEDGQGEAHTRNQCGKRVPMSRERLCTSGQSLRGAGLRGGSRAFLGVTVPTA